MCAALCYAVCVCYEMECPYVCLRLLVDATNALQLSRDARKFFDKISVRYVSSMCFCHVHIMAIHRLHPHRPCLVTQHTCTQLTGGIISQHGQYVCGLVHRIRLQLQKQKRNEWHSIAQIHTIRHGKMKYYNKMRKRKLLNFRSHFLLVSPSLSRRSLCVFFNLSSHFYFSKCVTLTTANWEMGERLTTAFAY